MFEDALSLADAIVAETFDTVALRAETGQGDRPPFSFTGSIERMPHFQGAGGADRLAMTRIAILAHRSGWPWMPVRGDRLVGNASLFTVLTVDEADSPRPCFWVSQAPLPAQEGGEP